MVYGNCKDVVCRGKGDCGCVDVSCCFVLVAIVLTVNTIGIVCGTATFDKYRSYLYCE